MPEERRIWNHQARRLISLGFAILSEFSKGIPRDQEITVVASLAMRVLVMLTDLKGWKCITEDNHQYADIAVEGLIEYLGSDASGSYVSISRYISTLDSYSLQTKSINYTDDKFLITASTITLALRPFYLRDIDLKGPSMLDKNHAAKKYFVYMLTIPWLLQRLPSVLRPALKHKSILFPCFLGILVSIVNLEQCRHSFLSKLMTVWSLLLFLFYILVSYLIYFFPYHSRWNESCSQSK